MSTPKECVAQRDRRISTFTSGRVRPRRTISGAMNSCSWDVCERGAWGRCERAVITARGAWGAEQGGQGLAGWRAGGRAGGGGLTRVPTRLTGVSVHVSIASPKSQILQTPSAVTMRFSGFKSCGGGRRESQRDAGCGGSIALLFSEKIPPPRRRVPNLHLAAPDDASDRLRFFPPTADDTAAGAACRGRSPPLKRVLVKKFD